MRQARFRTKQDYIEWVRHWRKQYMAASSAIRYYKTNLKLCMTTPQKNHVRALLRREQMLARNLMIAREAVSFDFLRWAAEKNAEYSEARRKIWVEAGQPEMIGRSITKGLKNE